MRHSIVTIAIATVSILPGTTRAQLTLEHVEPDAWLMPAELQGNGLKYISYEVINNAFIGLTDSLRLLNADYTPWRTIALPDGSGPCVGQGAEGFNLFYLSDALFDTDPSDVEFMLAYLCNGNFLSVGIYDENGNVLLEEPYAGTWEYFSSYKYYSIHNTSDGLKLNLITYDPNAPTTTISGTKIWSLPGTFITQVAPNTPQQDLLTAFPNPSEGTLNIRTAGNYTMAISDAQGRLLNGPTRTARDGTTELQLNGVDGVYFLEVRDEQGLLLGVRRVVLSR